ncbi:MAG: hypothetical protein GX282_00400 [Campylobacteraceae bacterium]|nr:hypothetical protein [Campylobacteraceae bacterium]
MAENTIQNPLKKLEELGISEVAKATHIEAEYIKHIIDKNFDALKGRNIKAFIKIIEREYDLDLGSWVDEYRAHTMDNVEMEEEPKFKKIREERVYIKRDSALPKYIFILVLIIATGWAIVNFKLYDISKFFQDSNKTALNYSTNSTMIEEAGDKLEKTGIEIIKLEPKEELNALERLALIDENLTDENLTLEDENLTIEEEKEETPEMVVSSSDISMVPGDKIWVGMINLETGKKSTITTDKEFKFELDKEQLVLTGHGLFSINRGGELEKFNDKNPHRFHIKDGKVTQISYDEFLKLNKGKAW